MYGIHPCFNTPSDSTKIWRYMDFMKFVQLLSTGGLFFAKPDQFEDPWEVQYPPSNYNREIIRSSLSHLSEPEETLDRIVDMIVDGMVNTEELRNTFALNCWCESENESDALWKVYATEDRGVAIRSTILRFKEALNVCSKRNVHIGSVNYVDYNDMRPLSGNIFLPVIYKRKSFEHEKEVRAVIWEKETQPGSQSNCKFDSSGGELVTLDIGILIEEVVISPLAPQRLVGLVKDICEKYGFNFPVRKSTHLDPPNYLRGEHR